ncbi:hypothetical protein [Rhizobium ruizarguesonis]|uniref:hypothetical protein n=1 Tax=Rhizobium ruizarguesonis TaxID=2081791 RepID=UPI00102FF174|nr:hypothetical protein [Rhizobium ruizarguesonis]TAU61541.1 hypothetical protein ELI46_30380 [Rhizobium ruizarguesonis]
MDQIISDTETVGAKATVNSNANGKDTECESSKRCVDARNYEKLCIARMLFGSTYLKTIGHQSSRDRIEAEPFSGNGDAIIRALAPKLNEASAQPAGCGAFIDKLEMLEKGRQIEKIRALYHGPFELIESLAIDPPEPFRNEDRKKIIGYNAIAAHIKLSLYELEEEAKRDSAFLAEAEAHYKKALKCLLEWKEGKPALWKVRKLKMVTNLAVITEHQTALNNKSSEEFEADLRALCDEYSLIEDLFWYSAIVPRVFHYYINAVELCSILNKKPEWVAGMSLLAGKVDYSKFRRDFIAKCYGDADELPTFERHFEWLAEFDHNKTYMRKSS